jgi:CMP-N-acetylneuraminic acid synthetase
MAKSVVAAIFARGGSKGVPRKNLRLINGSPLIAYAIRTALGVRAVSRVVVSTDDLEIAEVARSHGAEVPFMRPAELATDEASEWHAWQHAIKTLEAASGQFDLFVSIPTVCPLRTSEDV